MDSEEDLYSYESSDSLFPIVSEPSPSISELDALLSDLERQYIQLWKKFIDSSLVHDDELWHRLADLNTVIQKMRRALTKKELDRLIPRQVNVDPVSPHVGRG